ncbi:MAG: hypothetical protein KAS11_06335 [Candidatus Aenigmarchaeota archaeon]|nr:hypothetical protein [Candidatus Aenigmarchaeota archaeon]MCK5234946.1 hypothetical protein [Candidatus Aenigmarchaeota archaeon]
MQQIHGLLYFEGKTLEEVKSIFDKFIFDNIKYAYFDSLTRYDNKISAPGIFLTGEVKDTYSSKKIIEIFREQMDLGTELKGCDISIASEDTLKPLKNENLKGNYTGIRIKPPYDLEKIYNLASRIGTLTDAEDIFIRTVEPDEEGRPLVCIDLITKQNFDNYKDKIEEIISTEKLKLGKYTSLSFV